MLLDSISVMVNVVYVTSCVVAYVTVRYSAVTAINGGSRCTTCEKLTVTENLISLRNDFFLPYRKALLLKPMNDSLP